MIKPFGYDKLMNDTNRKEAVKLLEKAEKKKERLVMKLEESIDTCLIGLRLSMPSAPKYLKYKNKVLKVSRQFIGFREIGSRYYTTADNSVTSALREFVSHKDYLINTAKHKDLADASLRILTSIVSSNLLNNIVIKSRPFKILHVYSWEEFSDSNGSDMVLLSFISPWLYKTISVGICPADNKHISPGTITKINPNLVLHAFLFHEILPSFNRILKESISAIQDRLDKLKKIKSEYKDEWLTVRKYVTLSVL